jgi:hypothetical protein
MQIGLGWYFLVTSQNGRGRLKTTQTELVLDSRPHNALRTQEDVLNNTHRTNSDRLYSECSGGITQNIFRRRSSTQNGIKYSEWDRALKGHSEYDPITRNELKNGAEGTRITQNAIGMDLNRSERTQNG